MGKQKDMASTTLVTAHERANKTKSIFRLTSSLRSQILLHFFIRTTSYKKIKISSDTGKMAQIKLFDLFTCFQVIVCAQQ